MTHTHTRTFTEKVTATRRFEFDAGHRVLGHEGKCRHIHGHRYVAEVTVAANRLNALGMVIDFSVLKDEVGTWINDNWDHNFICSYDDPLPKLGRLMVEQGIWKDEFAPFEGRPPYVMDNNPTAENMAKVLFKKASQLVAYHKIQVTHVRLWETPNCYADFWEEDND